MSHEPASQRSGERRAREPDPGLARLLETEARLRRLLEAREAEARRIIEAARAAAKEREEGAERELAEAESVLRERVRHEVERERREILAAAVERVRRWRHARRERVPELARWVAARILEESDP